MQNKADKGGGKVAWSGPGSRAYALVAPTSMGARLTPAGRRTVYESELFHMQATSAESNVLTIAASLGQRVKVLTAFVQKSPVARFIQNDLRRRGVEFEGPELPQGGPWGWRHQFNIADSGCGVRGPRVANDRAGEIGRILESSFYDLDTLFDREGVRTLHLSGLIAALSPATGQLCLELAERAARAGTRISFDLNYRASFWAGREGELRELFSALAARADVLVGNEEDFQLALGLEGPETGGRELGEKIDGFQAMIAEAAGRYPHVGLFTTTLREVVSADEHLWGALLYENGSWVQLPPRRIPVTDRIGGGDAYVGGLLYGLDRGWTPERAAQFGWATGALAAGTWTDYFMPADEEQVWSVWKGNARVVR